MRLGMAAVVMVAALDTPDRRAIVARLSVLRAGGDRSLALLGKAIERRE
jgi:hypothetical protein